MQNLEKSMISKLIETAMEQLKFSYTPYSNFKVGASLLTKNGQIYTGCNIENAAYTPTNCAERTAIFKAVSEGHTNFKALAVVADTEGPCAPCGACRQVMGEFNIPIIIMRNMKGNIKVVSIEALLPFSFSSNDVIDR